MSLNKLTAIVCALFTAVSSAMAGDSVTTEQARQFVNALPALTALGKEMEAEGKTALFDTAMEPKADEPFEPYSQPIAMLQSEFPAEYKRVNKIAKENGFADAVAMADAADTTMLTYAALMMPPETAQMMGAMSPQMLAMIPEAQRAELEKGMAVMKALSAVSEENKDAVRPVLPLINAFVMKTAEEEGVADAVSEALQQQQ